MGKSEPHSIVRHMGLTHQEFLRSLPAAAEGMELRVEGTRVLMLALDGRVEIQLGREQKRLLGSLVLPQTRVDMRFEGFSSERREGFLKRFDRAFQRGGG